MVCVRARPGSAVLRSISTIRSAVSRDTPRSTSRATTVALVSVVISLTSIWISSVFTTTARPSRLGGQRARHGGSAWRAPLDRLGADLDDVARLGALVALGGLELHGRAFGERLVAVACDVAVVHEEILPALGGGDEAVTLRIVEPLHGSSSHKKHLPYQFTNG